MVLLPVLGIFYFRYKAALQQQYVIPYSFNTKEGTPPELLRNYTTIEIGGNSEENKQLLSQAQKKIQKLTINKDKVNGVHFIFNKESKYSDLIQTLNICLLENATHIAEKEHLWILYTDLPNIKSTNDEKIILINLNEDDVVMPYTFPLRLELLTSGRALKFQLKAFITQLQQAKSFWPIGILYLIMVALTTQKVVRLVKNQQQTTSN